MKRIALILLCAIAGFTNSANAAVHVSFDFFYNSLSPYGEWVTAGDYGAVWHPSDVDDEWTPYTDGYWSYTDAGWTWVSYEDWGGITYHYGRWVRVDGYGWCWVPDYEWGPAWVSWRRSDDYVGWAPLPPEARWRHGTGFGIWVDTEYDIGPGWFRFCRVRDFGSPFIGPVLLPRERNYTIIQQTVNITNISYRSDRGHAFNRGPDYGWVAPLVARPIPALKLVRNTSDVYVPGRHGKVFVNAPRGNTLVVAAPSVRPGASPAPSAIPAVARSFTSPHIDRGWKAPSNATSLDPIRAAFRKQSEGVTPANAPARGFKPDLVSHVPKKANPNATVVTQQPVPQPATVAPGVPAAPAVPATAGVPESARKGGRFQPPIAGPQPVVPDAIPRNRGRNSGAPQPQPTVNTTPAAPAIVAPPSTPKVAPATAAVPAVQPPPTVVRTPSSPPAISTEPRGGRIGKKPFKIVETPQPAIAPPTSLQPKDDGAARIAREQADMAARKRDAEAAAARTLDQQRAAESARRHQLILDEKRKQDAAAAAADRQRRDAAAADNARSMAESQRAAKEQARIADAQRHQNEVNARRAADEGRMRQNEMQRQQQAAAAAAEHARRQAAAQRAPAPIAAPPQHAPTQPQIPHARPAPPANAAPAAQGDPRVRRGKGEDDKGK